MEDCSLQFIGNATTLLRLGPFTILTDPNFLHRGQWAYLGHGLASRRRLDPALRIEDLPALDAIVLSHMHGDHWDRVAKRGLDHDLPVLTTPAAARALHRQRFTAAEGLPTWRSHTLRSGDSSLTVTALPGRHGVGVARFLVPPVMGSLLELDHAGSRHSLYISGDTLMVEELAEIPRRFPGVDAAVLHLGGTTLPGGLVVTMDALQGADLLELIGAPRNVPVHFDDYGVFKSPLDDFRAEVDRRGLVDRVTYVARGGTTAL
jgi:L-ascorbate metabolism protein UlaG (beta-lactamase superfamily)